jgi:hypothetical protein
MGLAEEQLSTQPPGISAVFQASSRRDSRSQEAARVVRRKTNRRHITGDHHGREAERATLLVSVMDEILGTHRSPSKTCTVSPDAPNGCKSPWATGPGATWSGAAAGVAHLGEHGDQLPPA